MRADPHAAWGDRTPLYDDAGDVAVVFTLAESTRSGRPWVDGVWRPDHVSVEHACDVVLSAFAGYSLSTSDVALADALTSYGATQTRHAHTMTHDLVDLPEVATDSGVTCAALDRDGLHAHADALGSIAWAAYPADHPDHHHDEVAQAVAEMHAVAEGKVLGAYLDISTLATVDGAVAGACLTVVRPGAAPDGGPWVLDVFREPRLPQRGIGAALLGMSLRLARAAQLPSVSLVVSHDNASARRVYERLGFVATSESRTLLLP